PTSFDRPKRMLDNLLPARANTLATAVAKLLVRANKSACSVRSLSPHRKAIFPRWKNCLHPTLFRTPMVAGLYTSHGFPFLVVIAWRVTLLQSGRSWVTA